MRPKDAAAYLSQMPLIKSIVVGASNKRHITETFPLLLDALMVPSDVHRNSPGNAGGE